MVSASLSFPLCLGAESAQSLQAGGECTIAVDGLAPPPDLLVGDRASGADGGGDGAESAVAQNTEQPQQALQEEHSPSRSPRSISGWTGTTKYPPLSVVDLVARSCSMVTVVLTRTITLFQVS